jgi:hypothetical protein
MLQNIVEEFKLAMARLDRKLGHYDLAEFTSPEQEELISEMFIQRYINPNAKLKLRSYKNGPIRNPIINIYSQGLNPIYFTRKKNRDGAYWLMNSFFAQEIEKKIGFGNWLDALTLHTTDEQTAILDRIYTAGRRVYFLEDSLPEIIK